MATHHDDVELTIGDSWLIIGLLLDEEGNPIDLTVDVNLGWTLVGPDGKQIPGLVDAAELTPQAGGIVHILLPDSFTRALQPARYLDAIRVWVSGLPVTQWTGVILANADPFHSEIAA